MHCEEVQGYLKRGTLRTSLDGTLGLCNVLHTLDHSELSMKVLACLLEVLYASAAVRPCRSLPMRQCVLRRAQMASGTSLVAGWRGTPLPSAGVCLLLFWCTFGGMRGE